MERPVSELIRTHSSTVAGSGGRTYRAHVMGTERENGTWEARIVFDPVAGTGPELSTDRETTQPNRTDLEYWASGLEPAYIEGALSRATRIAEKEGAGTAPEQSAAGAVRPEAHAILDPYDVFSQGEETLREELSALHLQHLQNIVLAYGFADAADQRLDSDQEGLRELIIQRVREDVSGG